VTFGFVILVAVGVLIAIFLIAANRDANQTIKKQHFERVAQGTRSHLAIVPNEKNTAAVAPATANFANLWSGESAQAASFGTSGRVQ